MAQSYHSRQTNRPLSGKREHVVDTDCRETCYMDFPDLLARNQEGMDGWNLSRCLGEHEKSGIYLCRICRNKSRQKEPLSYGNNKLYMTITCRGSSLLSPTHVGGQPRLCFIPEKSDRFQWGKFREGCDCKFKREANMGLRDDHAYDQVNTWCRMFGTSIVAS